MEIGITVPLSGRGCRLLFHAWVILLGIALQACGSRDTSGTHTKADHQYSMGHIESLSVEHPVTALALIDSAEARDFLGPFEAEYMRCVVNHNGLSNFKRALHHALRAYHMPEAQKDGDAYLNLLDLIACEYYENGDYSNSVRFCTEGLTMARDSANVVAEANFNITLGQVLMKMRQQEQAFERFDMAMKMLRKEAFRTSIFRHMDDYVYAIKTTIDAYAAEKRYQEAVNLVPDYREALDALTKMPDTPPGVVDARWAGGYAAFAHIYAEMKLNGKAQEMYRLLDSTQFAHTKGGHQLRVAYLLSTGRFAEALYHQQKAKKFWLSNADSMSYDFLERQLMPERTIYMGLKDYQEANNISDRILRIGDSLRQRERRDDALKQAGVYRAQEQAMNTQRMAASLQHRNIIMSLVTVVLLVGMIYLLRMAVFNQLIRKKDTSMVSTIRELMDNKEALQDQNTEVHALRMQIRELEQKLLMLQGGTQGADTTETAPGVPAAEHEDDAREDDRSASASSRLNEQDRKLFEHIHHSIITRQLFLKPDCSKKDLMKEFHIPSNKFSSLFRECAGCSFNQYIQNCRLDHAVHLMNQYPHWSIESVAAEAQMSKSAFYDQFQRKYGMKPLEFRKKGANNPTAITPPQYNSLIMNNMSSQE